MHYSLEKINTVQACNNLLALAQQKKQTLERQRRNLGESIDTFRQRMTRMHKESATVRASLDALNPAYHAMPRGKDKATMNIMIKRLELRQARLEILACTYNVANLLVKELRYNRLDAQLSVMEGYIDAIEHTKNRLSQPNVSGSLVHDLFPSQIAQQNLQVSLIPYHLIPQSLNPSSPPQRYICSPPANSFPRTCFPTSGECAQANKPAQHQRKHRSAKPCAA
jgi:hypothetical protein